MFLQFLAIPFTIAYNLLSGFIRAIGNSKQPFYFLIASSFINIFLDVILILILGMGVEGAGIATLISQCCASVMCWIYIKRKLKLLIPKGEETRFDNRLISILLNNGIPMGMQFSITAIGIIMLQSANNALGTTYVAAFTASMRIKYLFTCVLENIGVAMATYCGQNYGAGKPERILQGIKVSSLMMLTYAAATWMILMLGSRWLALLFVAPSEVEILDYTEQFLHISCWFFPAVGLLCILRYAIQGVGFSNLAMLSGVSEMIARILVSLYAVPAFGFLGVCFGDPLAWVAADLFLIPAFLYVYKKIKKRLDDEKVSVSAV